MPLNQDVGKGRKHAYMEVSSRAAQEAKAEERKLCRAYICQYIHVHSPLVCSRHKRHRTAMETYMDVLILRAHDYMDIGGRATPGAVAEDDIH